MRQLPKNLLKQISQIPLNKTQQSHILNLVEQQNKHKENVEKIQTEFYDFLQNTKYSKI